ncbi:Protein of unknown function (DUF3014) [Spongiibacter sp. IMCC21906]|jgi:hypothetical protein|uniref:DUF3014 domain-containing protein n=1 Tax=Spongiibacter sp. IMCC21906 TaxID=1620392 RepID=UPI00062DD986|nr:DUF3014 domain-containing protein [Spongiibacter sp. IMCC21906]AKH69234.1 Protein of unknown function (DUF3014) [Spongiibacter sp. IMCC21906]
MNWKAISAVVAIVAVAAFVWFILERSATTGSGDVVDAPQTIEPSKPKKTVKETLAVESDPEYKEKAETIVAPPAKVDDSDDKVREAAADLSEPLSKWLLPAQQIRKWVALVEQMASNKLPSRNMPVSYNKDSFLVIEKGDALVADPANFERWDTLINTITALDPKQVAIYYKKWSPLLETSYNELGNPQSFDNQFRTTVEHMLFVEPISANAKLKQPKVFYEYVDPKLENADALSKWMWRLGPENMEALQAWLKELQSYL